MNEKHQKNIFHEAAGVNLMAENVTQWKIVVPKCVDMSAKKQNIVYEEDYTGNPSILDCEYDKDCQIGKYSEKWTSIKSPFDDLVIICNEILNTPAMKNVTDKTNYQRLIQAQKLNLGSTNSQIFSIPSNSRNHRWGTETGELHWLLCYCLCKK